MLEGVCLGLGALAVGFWIRIYRIYRIIEDVFVSNLMVICKWVIFFLLFADAWTHRLFPERFHLIFHPINHKNQKNHSSDKSWFNIWDNILFFTPIIGIESPKIRREASRLYPDRFHLMFHPMNQKNQKKSQFRQEVESIFGIVFCFLHLFFHWLPSSSQVHQSQYFNNFSALGLFYYLH